MYLNVLTGSMAPTIEEGENIIIKRCKAYEIGDIITYTTKDNYLVTHRIISIDGNLYYTKGDFNNTSDSEPVHINQIYGKVIFHFKSLIQSSINSFAKFISTSTSKVESNIANPIFIVDGDNEIIIKKYGSINNYEFSVKNYNDMKVSEVSFIYNIDIIADSKVDYQLFSGNVLVDVNNSFNISHSEPTEQKYSLKIKAPEDYEGVVKINVYAYQEEV